MKKSAFVLFTALTALSVPLWAQTDPCSQSTQLSATAQGAQSWNGTKSATTVGGSGDDAYGVEAWTEAGGTATKLTWYGPNQGGGHAFRAEWTNSTDYLGRFGYFWGGNGKKWSSLGDLCVDYNYKRSANGTGGSYSYLGVYGWTIGSSNSAEFYIVEDWFGSGQQAANNLGNNCQTHSNITVDGKTYSVVTCIRPQGSGCVSCNNQAFGQVFSIRQGMRNPEPPKCGTISIKKHFEAWTNMKTEKSGQSPAKYIYDKTYEAKFLVEAQGGTGWFDATYMKFSRTGACGGGTSTNSSSSTGGGTPSSSSIATQATTCKTPLITYPPSTVPTDPYTACFKHTNNKCYVCKVSSEGEFEGNINTCASSWVWDGSQLESNLTDGYWYQEVPCPGTSSSSGAVASSSSKASSSSVAATSSSSRASSSSAAATSSSSRVSSSSRASSSSGAVASSSSVEGSFDSSSSEEEDLSSSSGEVSPIKLIRPLSRVEFRVLSLKGALQVESHKGVAIKIYNIDGNEVLKFDAPAGESIIQVSLTPGIYIVKNANTKKAQKVMVK